MVTALDAHTRDTRAAWEHATLDDDASRPVFETAREAHARRPLSIPPLRPTLGERDVRPLDYSFPPDAMPDVDLAELEDGLRRIGQGMTPQQRYVGIVVECRRDATDAFGRPKFPRVAIQVPRRSGKTSGIWGLLIGRCANRPFHMASYSAQSGQKGYERFLEVARDLERWDPDPENLRYRVYRGKGDARIEWTNGSVLRVLKPEADAFRGDAYDTIVLDEAQEVDPADGAVLLGGINPTMDTRPTAQLIVAGTTGKVRAGLFWDALERGRAGKWGVVNYGAADHEDPTLDSTLLSSHPGIGTLTTLETIQERREEMHLVEFMREYLGMWPTDATVGAIDLDAWSKAGTSNGIRGERVALAFDVAPDASAASLSCAWRDDDGRAHVELLAMRPGVAWLPGEAHRVAREAGAVLAYDVIGANTNPADAIHRKRPTVKLEPMNLRDVQGAAQRFVTELMDDQLRHLAQKDVDLAVAGAAWRTIGDGGRAFGHKASSHDITPLTSAALALWAYDKTTTVKRRRRRLATVPTEGQ